LLHIEIERLGDGPSIVALSGELDLSTLPKLENPLLGELHANDGVIVDLSRLSFIDSSGIGLLIKAHRAAENGRALHTVVAAGSQVERVFALAGIDRALPLHLDRDQAIAALAASDGDASRGT